jgi:hypothetical protein
MFGYTATMNMYGGCSFFGIHHVKKETKDACRNSSSLNMVEVCFSKRR